MARGLPAPSPDLASAKAPPWPLPDSAALRCGARHRRIFGAAECLGKGRRIRERPVGSKWAKRMFVSLEDQARVFRSISAGPNLREAKKEPLIGCETFDQRGCRLALETFFEPGISDGETAQIGDALAFDEFPVLVKSLIFVAVKLFRDAIATRLKILQVLWCPPVIQVTLCVKFGSLVIEPVRHLMADDRADPSVVDRTITIRIKKRRLEKDRRENNFVHRWIVIGVDGWRRHVPLGAVDGFADFRDVARELERIAAQVVFHVRTTFHVKGRVVAPLLGISDLEVHRRELLNGFLSCGRAHPIKSGEGIV